ncbi:DNA -binding domain-containing protein [Shumkonia mesophila]|uniref:DNA -binding domain-containing protein n=1 Tax=Shumkonia mesophila TaxID=2838854 RepID=UPI0029342AB4|nr:DUF2285 domain-containing protein [Shumkonia mesophila]
MWLSELGCRTTVLLTPDGMQHLELRDGGRALQLCVSGASIFDSVHLMTDAVVDPRRLRARLDALGCLNELLAEGKFPARSRPDDSRGRRLREVLQALDGWLIGASYREIAIALFGESPVEADWRDPRDHLRDRVRRAIRRGRTLMAGGYRMLLL